MVQPTLPSYASLEPELKTMLDSGMLTKGKHLARFEEALAQHFQVKHALGVSSCTIGLMLAYQALELKGEVIVPSFTFMATVSSMIWAGLTPVFVDVDRDSCNLDPNKVEAAITARTCAIVAVHNFGNPARMQELQQLAAKHNLKLVFDAAHGLGSLYRGQPVGNQGDAQVFSLTPTKLVVAGEGGVVTTNHDDVAYRVKIAREYGNDGNYGSLMPGLNGRMAEFNALLGFHSLQMNPEVVSRRNHLTGRYRSGLTGVPGIHFQVIAPEDRSSYKDFSIVIEPSEFGLTRDEVAAALLLDNVDSRKYYYPAVHEHSCYRQYWSGTPPLPNTDWLAKCSLSLPLYGGLEESAVERVCEVLRGLQERSEQVRESLAPAATSA